MYDEKHPKNSTVKEQKTRKPSLYEFEISHLTPNIKRVVLG